MTTIVRAVRRHPRWSIAGVLLVVLVVAGVLLVNRSSGSAAPELATARTGTLDRTVVVTGTLQPSQRSDLSFPAGGEVVSVDVTVGQQVAAGQKLAAVDAASLTGQVAQARSALASAEARLAADRSADASDAQIDADRAAIDSAQAQLDVARQNAAQATLTAPFAGTVAAVDVTVGEQVAGGGSVSSAASSAAASAASGAAAGAGAAGAAAASAPASSGSASGAAVVVVSTGSYVVDATVDDTQVGSVAAGQEAAITPSGAAEPIPGTVASVGLVASASSGVASYPVSITVTGSPPGLHLGSGAQVEIIIERITNAVLVPSSAVRGTGAETTVTVVEGDDQVSRPVGVGATAGGRTQITQGLASGEQVVLPAAAPPAENGGFGGGPGGGGGGGGDDEQPGGGS